MASRKTRRAESRQKPRPRAEWTLLIYLASDNNLSEDCVYSLTEMNEVVQGGACRGTNTQKPEVHIVARLDPVGRGNSTLFFEVTQNKRKLAQKVIGTDTRENDSGRKENMLDFLLKHIRLFPAHHYMVVLQGHGAGVLDGFFLSDDNRPASSVPSSLRVRYLKEIFDDPALKRVLGHRRIDVLGFDSCLMSTVEVCYQLRTTPVDVVLGSEGFALNSGWPYEAIARKLKEDPPKDGETLARFIVKEQKEYYGEYYLGGLSLDIAAIRQNRIGELRTRIGLLAEELTREFKQLKKKSNRDHYNECGEPFQDAVLLAHWASQSYNGEQCVDLYDFCDLLQKRLGALCAYEKIQKLSKDVMDAIYPWSDTTAVITNDHVGSAFQHSNGISIYFPWSAIDVAPEYQDLTFVTHRPPKWREFLRQYHEATQRRPRNLKVKKLEINREPIVIRSTPPVSKGPDSKVHSMRNPPTTF